MNAPGPVLHKVKLARSPVNLRHRPLPPLPPGYRRLLREREEEGFERGRLQAEQSLTTQIVSQRGEMVQLQNGVLRSLSDAVGQVVRETEGTVIEIALATAARLVAGLPIDAEMVTAAVREALAQVEEVANVQVLLHPEDLALLKNSESDLVSEADDGRLRLTNSPDVSRGGCVVRTHFGDIDGRRETKLDQMRKAVTA
jgi:flagellar assembly protein FliH